jgi:hypothetical protein
MQEFVTYLTRSVETFHFNNQSFEKNMMKLRSLLCILLLATIHCSFADTKPEPDLVEGTNLRRLGRELKANVDLGIDPGDPNVELFEDADQDETVRKR